MISLIMLGSVMNYLTRSTLAVAAPTVLHELRIGEREYSWIVGAFQGAIMAQPICGYVLDVLGLKIGFAIFAVTWSLVNMTHAAANSWQALAWLRGLLGFSEGSANPAGMKATAEWFPAQERGLAGGVCHCGRPGTDLGRALVAVLSATGETPRSFGTGAGIYSVWSGEVPAKRWLAAVDAEHPRATLLLGNRLAALPG
jgi:MFS transporter, ACS family, aldohexuronate transporter